MFVDCEVHDGGEVLHRSASLDLHQVYRTWCDAAADGVPVLRDFLDPLTRLRDRVILYEQDGNDFFYHHVGSTIAGQAGFHMIGLYLSDLPDASAAEVMRVTRDVADSGTPRYVRLSFQNADRAVFWERLLVPLRRHHRNPIPMVAAFVNAIDSVEQILLQVFRDSQIGIVILRPITAADGAVTDGWIMLANDRACRHFDYDPTTASDRRIRSLVSPLRDDHAWRRLFGPRQEHRSLVVGNAATGQFLTPADVGTYVVLRVSDLMRLDGDVVVVE